MANSYFKKDGVVVKATSAPFSVEGDVKLIHPQGAVTNLTSHDSTPGGIFGIASGNLTPWEKASELEYQVHYSLKMKLEASADRDIRSRMWALNNADSTLIRLGGNFPEDKSPVKISSVKDKIAIIALTQHWFRQDLPMSRDSNSVWTNWIIRTRRDQPFVYLGTAVDLTEDN